MSAIILHRTDSAKHMRRFYRLDVQPDLFGQWCFIREWGRIGRAGQLREVAYGHRRGSARGPCYAALRQGTAGVLPL
jgi:predicted DNA-binding WGR domain protein